jgi:hypothetical protein
MAEGGGGAEDVAPRPRVRARRVVRAPPTPPGLETGARSGPPTRRRAPLPPSEYEIARRGPTARGSAASGGATWWYRPAAAAEEVARGGAWRQFAEPLAAVVEGAWDALRSGGASAALTVAAGPEGLLRVDLLRQVPGPTQRTPLRPRQHPVHPHRPTPHNTHTPTPRASHAHVHMHTCAHSTPPRAHTCACVCVCPVPSVCVGRLCLRRTAAPAPSLWLGVPVPRLLGALLPDGARCLCLRARVRDSAPAPWLGGRRTARLARSEAPLQINETMLASDFPFV